jgi:hypothetical protein
MSEFRARFSKSPIFQPHHLPPHLESGAEKRKKQGFASFARKSLFFQPSLLPGMAKGDSRFRLKNALEFQGQRIVNLPCMRDNFGELGEILSGLLPRLARSRRQKEQISC